MIVERAAIAAAATAALALTAGCQGNTTPGPTTYVTVPAPAPSSTTSSTTAAASTTPTPTAPTTTAPTTTAPTSTAPTERAMSRLPGPCDTTIPLGSVIDALGRPISGGTAFVVGTPDAAIDRVSYINCRYGVRKTSTTAAVEIGVSLYRSPAKAAARLAPTIEDYEQHAATATTTTVSGLPATLLDGGSGAGYGPTIVLAAGQRTIAVSMRPGVVAGARLVKDLTTLAALAAERTASG